MRIVEISKEQFKKITVNNSLDNYYQTIEYGNLMSNFGFVANYIAIFEKEKLIGTSLILSHQIFINFKYGYAPHGILCDYTNYSIMPQLIKALKKYLFKQGYLILKMDPLIIKTIRDKNGNIIQSNTEIQKIMNVLKQNEFVHCGFNNYMEAVKPRWHAILNIKDASSSELFYKLDKTIRNKLRKAVKFGVEIFKDNTDNVEKIYSYINTKGNYSLEYYKQFKKEFKDEFEVYYARINTEAYVKNSTYLYEKESETNDYLNNLIQEQTSKGKDLRAIINKKIESDKILASYKKHLIRAGNLLKKNSQSIIIGGAIIINHNNRLYLLIDGFDKEYGNLNPSYLLKWKIIEKYAHKSIETFDLNAISGNFTNNENNKYKGLNESKLGFNSKAVEYIGEFNLICNKAMYSIYRNTKTKYNLKDQKK